MHLSRVMLLGTFPHKRACNSYTWIPFEYGSEVLANAVS